MPRLKKAKALEAFRVSLEFDDGKAGIVDLSHLAGKGVFRMWNDRKAFEAVTIGLAGELRWGDQIDLCPDSLYLKVTGKSPEEIFPGIRTEPTHA